MRPAGPSRPAQPAARGKRSVRATRCGARAEPADEGGSILNLYDAFGPEVVGTVQDFGYSALIRYGELTILFDAGTNADILERNAQALGVDFAAVDFAVASHSHFDHISGFDHVLDVHPDVPIYFPHDPFWGAPLPFDATGTDPEAVANLPLERRRSSSSIRADDSATRMCGS